MYHDAFKALPLECLCDGRRGDGESARVVVVRILPFIEQTAAYELTDFLR